MRRILKQSVATRGYATDRPDCVTASTAMMGSPASDTNALTTAITAAPAFLKECWQRRMVGRTTSPGTPAKLSGVCATSATVVLPVSCRSARPSTILWTALETRRGEIAQGEGSAIIPMEHAVVSSGSLVSSVRCRTSTCSSVCALGVGESDDHDRAPSVAFSTTDYSTSRVVRSFIVPVHPSRGSVCGWW